MEILAYILASETNEEFFQELLKELFTKDERKRVAFDELYRKRYDLAKDENSHLAQKKDSSIRNCKNA